MGSAVLNMSLKSKSCHWTLLNSLICEWWMYKSTKAEGHFSNDMMEWALPEPPLYLQASHSTLQMEKLSWRGSSRHLWAFQILHMSLLSVPVRKQSIRLLQTQKKLRQKLIWYNSKPPKPSNITSVRERHVVYVANNNLTTDHAKNYLNFSIMH